MELAQQSHKVMVAGAGWCDVGGSVMGDDPVFLCRAGVCFSLHFWRELSRHQLYPDEPLTAQTSTGTRQSPRVLSLASILFKSSEVCVTNTS